ncbi:MAG: CHASE2 domain-containing protein [Leptolyngbyaceae cyanobacterium bins.302]|nr:CHASE2 domain-containing protein [Leptolyngbyaceae cyanobacterium bins.302]
MNWRFRDYGWRLCPGAVIAIGLTVLFRVGVFSPLEELAYLSLFHLRGAQPWDDRIVLIAIDDPSIQKIGRFPWSRQQYAKLLQVLSRSSPSIVALGLVFSEPTPDDAKFAAAMAQSGRVVLAQAKDGENLNLLPVPLLQQEAIATGHILYSRGLDGITQNVPTIVDNVPALGLAIVEAYSLTKEKVIPERLKEQIWINWAGSVQSLPQYSFVDVIQGNVRADVFRDKIVLVGVTASAISPLATPYNRAPPASGIHLHAAVVDTLLKGDGLHKSARFWFLLILLLGGPSLSLWFSYLRERTRLCCWASLCLGWLLLGLLGFKANVWMPVAMPLTLFTMTTVATSFTERFRTDLLLRRQIQHLWQSYRQDLVVPQAIEQGQTIAPPLRSSESVKKLAELAEQFGRSQSTQAAIARSLPVGLVAANLDGTVWFCNPVATQWLTIQPGENLQQHLVPTWLDEKAWEAVLQALHQAEALQSRFIQQGDCWYELTLEPLSYTSHLGTAAQEPNGLMVILSDITTQKQAEAALERQVQELHQLSRMKDDFLSTVSHELRTPLTNIQMAIELLKIAKTPEAKAQYLRILQTECKREVELINDLLDLQRLEAGVQSFNWQPLDMSLWLPRVIEPFYERAEAHHQILQLDLAPQLPIVISDESSLERVLAELMNNACKYTPPNETIQISAHASAEDLHLRVSNGGVEIPQQELTRIFDKFYRIPQTDRWKRGGTGLGLALTKKLIEHLGGSITATSSSGQITFALSLPINKPFQDIIRLNYAP